MSDLRPVCWFVYASGVFEAECSTLHGARRMAARLEREGFIPTVRAAFVDGDRSWNEAVSLKGSNVIKLSITTETALTAVTLYLLDPCHDDETLGRVTLVGKTLRLDMTADEASALLTEASNAADASNDGKPDRYDRLHSNALATLASRARLGGRF